MEEQSTRQHKTQPLGSSTLWLVSQDYHWIESDLLGELSPESDSEEMMKKCLKMLNSLIAANHWRSAE
jgi:hypothetical protein